MAAAIAQAVRSLRRAPWYTVTVTGVIALGITFIVTVFAIVDGVLFVPLPFADAERTFAVNGGWSRLSSNLAGPLLPASVPEFNTWRTGLPDGQFSAYYTGARVAVAPQEAVSGIRVDRAFFDVLGVRPVVGGFTSADFEAPSAVPPAILTYQSWQRRFRADSSVIGRTLIGDRGTGVQVVGILPQGFVIPDPYFGTDDEVLLPLPRERSVSTDLARYLRVIVRLPSSMTANEASMRLTSVAARMASSWPISPQSPNSSDVARIRARPYDRVTLLPVRTALTWRVRQTSAIVLWSAVGLMALTCMNIAGLAIGRVEDRWRDLTVRRALGAGQLQLIQLLLLENALLTAAGTSLGVLAAFPMTAATARLMPADMSLLKLPVIDGRVIVFSILTAVCCVALITIGSARAAWRSALQVALGSGSRTTRNPGLKTITAQVAIALVLAVGGALVATSLLRVWGEDLGIRQEDKAVLRVSAPRGASSSEIEQLIADLRHQPGVLKAGGMDRWLLEHSFNGSEFDLPDRNLDARTESVAVTTGYFDAADLRPLEGRVLSDSEISRGERVIVVSALTARQYWPRRQPLGQTLSSKGRIFTVIGVVPDIRYLALDDAPRGAIYYPLAARQPEPVVSTVLVTLAPRSRSPEELRAWLRVHCPSCYLGTALMISDAMAVSIRSRRFNAWLFTSFGVAALIIAGVGILGLVTMAVARRTRELGVRIALGATPARVIGQMIAEQAKAVAAGLLLGGIVASWAVRFVEVYLYKTSVFDSSSWVVAVLALLVVALIAAFVPSFQAGRVDPLVALKAE